MRRTEARPIPPRHARTHDAAPPSRDEQKISVILGTIEALSLVSLYFTRDLSLSVAALLVGVALFRILARPAFAIASLFALLVLLTGGTVLLASFENTHPALIAVQVIPLGHAILWLGGGRQQFQGARLGISLAELILASVLTADLYLALSLLVFGLLTTTYLRVRFLVSDARESRPRGVPPPRELDKVTPVFLRRSMGLGIVTFLAGLLIYPLIPRVSSQIQQPTLSVNREKAEVGLSESIHFKRWRLPLSGVGEGAIALRVFVQDAEKDLAIRPGALLRGKALARLSIEGWRPRDLLGLPIKPSGLAVTEVEILREPGVTSDTLFVPYGTEKVSTTLTAGTQDRIFVRPRSDASYPWAQPLPWGTRYWVELPKIPPKKTLLPHLGRSAPELDPLYLEVPLPLKDEKTLALATRLFSGKPSFREKIDALRTLFLESGLYSPTAEGITAPPGTAGGSSEEPRGQHAPVSTFLHETRRGHCEAFATAAAVILRLSGVPARIVSGFRIHRSPVSGVILVRSGDAHAWVEAWDASEGWTPLDFTPRTWTSVGFFEQLRDRYESAASYWARYVVAAGDFQEAVSVRIPALDFARDRFHRTLERHPYRALLILVGFALLGAIRHIWLNDWAQRDVALGSLSLTFPDWLRRWIRQLLRGEERERRASPPLWLLRLRTRGERWLQRRAKPKQVLLSPFESWESPTILALLESENEKKAWLAWVAAYEETRFGPSNRHHPKPELVRLLEHLEQKGSPAP